MKSSGICPKCAGRKLYGINPVQQTYCDAQGSLRSFNVTGARLPNGKKTLFGAEDTSLEVAGPFQACVCAGCGYTEWYVPVVALRMLERMVQAGAVTVIEPGGRSPFR